MSFRVRPRSPIPRSGTGDDRIEKEKITASASTFASLCFVPTIVFLRLGQPDARPAAVFGDEFDAATLKRLRYRRQACMNRRPGTPLKIRNRAFRDCSRRCEIGARPSYKRSGGSALFLCYHKFCKVAYFMLTSILKGCRLYAHFAIQGKERAWLRLKGLLLPKFRRFAQRRKPNAQEAREP